MAACILWDPEFVPEEWIDEQALQPHVLPYDPFDPDAHPWVNFWSTRFNELWERLLDVVGRSEPLTEELLTRIEQEVTFAAYKALHDVAGLRSPITHAVVPIFPGMTTSDWRRLEASMMETNAWIHGDNWLRVTVRRLVSEGMAIQSVANLLGLDRKTVQRWLSEPLPPDAHS